MFAARWPPLDSPGRSQKAIWLTVISSRPAAESQSSRLELVGPAPSCMLPASVGLKHSAKNDSPTSRLEADCNCRPWSVESMNSWPFQVSESIAPASREVVRITISEPPAGARIVAAPRPRPMESISGGDAKICPLPPARPASSSNRCRLRATGSHRRQPVL